jgi:3-oxoacyl-[acyl-carrier-protein] synthase III
MTRYRTKILGTGMYVPKKTVTNFDLEKMLDTSDEWITERTGIKERHLSDKKGGEFPSDMGTYAAQQALQNAGLTPNDLDMILFATCTADTPIPNTACIVQTKLGITNQCACLDVDAACSGFVYASTMANALITNGVVKTILLIGSDMLSNIADWQDRSTCVLFGDGAGAMIMGQAPDNEPSEFLACRLGADGTGRVFLEQPFGGSAGPITHEVLDKRQQFVQMKGRDIFKMATRTMAEMARSVLEQSGIKAEQVNWFIPHQANIRIIETTANLLGWSMEKTIVNIQKYGNTSAATIPMAFHEAVTEGKIKRGDLVIIDAFGGGLTCGAALFRY